MPLDFQRTRELLCEFKFGELFIDVLGWSQPSIKKAVALEIEDKTYTYKRIAELSGVVVFEVTADDGKIPEGKQRAAIHKEVTERIAENLLIFVDEERTRSLWYWVKREGPKRYFRDHLYVKGQPGDLFLGKLGSLVIDIAALEVSEPSVLEIAQKLQSGFDIERVTKKFYKEFQEEHQIFLQFIQGIDNEVDRRWYTSVILNRLMFVYFLQRKGFINNKDLDYLQNKLKQSKQRGEDRFFSEFLQTLFFEGFAKPEVERTPQSQALIGQVKYLNGGLFLKHQIENNEKYDITIADQAFEQILALFSRYSWNLDDTPGGKDDEINPDVLGYIFEKYINQKAFGAYYTRPEITEYLCDRTINKLILDRVNSASDHHFNDITELLIKLDANLCDRLIRDILPNLSLLDPACGSGAFLVAAMKTLISVYTAVIGTIKLKGDRELKKWLKDVEAKHPSLSYFVKKRIITDNLYGVDIMEEATEIAKLRLFLALVSSAQEVDELEPLPNIDFNIMAGNSLIGLIRVDEEGFDAVGESRHGKLLQILAASNYREILKDKNRSIEQYKKHAFASGEVQGTSQESRLQMLRDHIDKVNRESTAKLNQLLLDEFSTKLGIKYEEAQLTGKPKKRLLKIEDVEALKPFHWGYHFDKIIEERGGFDAIITNPPWEAFKPQAKEFFAQHNNLVTKNKMDIKAFEKEQKQLLENTEVANAWFEYQNQYPHVSSYYRSTEQYKNQISIVNGKKAGTDINLYKLFVEQCFNLLRSGGECGIVIPSGIYTDLGTKQLREMLFSQTEVTGLFCLENRKTIFEGVHRSFKIVILTFEKGGTTTEFPSAFMRLDVQELQEFPGDESLSLSVELIRRLSPDSLSVMEFKHLIEYSIAKKVVKHPLLNEKESKYQNIKFTRELAPSSKSDLFYTSFQEVLRPILEGRMIHQFTHLFSRNTRLWIKEEDARAIILKKILDKGQKLDYQTYRLAFRKVARSTDERTMIATIIPPYLCAENLQTVQMLDNQGKQVIKNIDILTLCAIWNSFVYDSLLRLKVSANINYFFVYSTQVPQIKTGTRFFNEIVERAAKLICTTPEFDELAQEVGLGSHENGVTNESERAKLRAELDGMIAHLYELTENEFQHILSTFPIVPEETKQAALEAYQTFAPLSGDPELVDLILQGENAELDFKASAWWDIPRNKKEKFNKRIIETTSAFLNIEKGGTLLIGVDDDGTVLGIEYDYNKKFENRKNRDVYENNLMTSLLSACGQDCGTCIQISFGQVEAKDVCRITILPSPRPIYIKDGQEEKLFIRAGNSNRSLSVREATDYIQNHWR